MHSPREGWAPLQVEDQPPRTPRSPRRCRFKSLGVLGTLGVSWSLGCGRSPALAFGIFAREGILAKKRTFGLLYGQKREFRSRLLRRRFSVEPRVPSFAPLRSSRLCVFALKKPTAHARGRGVGTISRVRSRMNLFAARAVSCQQAMRTAGPGPRRVLGRPVPPSSHDRVPCILPSGRKRKGAEKAKNAKQFICCRLTVR